MEKAHSVCGMAVGRNGFSLRWGAKWPQYVMMIAIPWCLSAAELQALCKAVSFFYDWYNFLEGITTLVVL
jgi:hypothetical protein